MKMFVIMLFVLMLIQETVFSQFGSTCLPDGIVFQTQNQIDSFQINYPGCTKIEGDVMIEGYEITNLNGLHMIKAVGGKLWIINSGLNLIGLPNLTYIGGNLRIANNDGLTNLAGLENLTSINGNLEIWWNDALVNLLGLESLTSINGSIDIWGNIGLTSLTGMDNINAGSIDNLYINLNYALSVCEVQSVCDYLASPNGIVDIYRNAPGCNAPPEIAHSCGMILPCFPYGNYHFCNQADIDNFQSDYPNCSEIKGDLFITGNYITNVDGLNIVTSIENDLIIWDNDILTSIHGLHNLSFIGGGLYISVNFILPSLTGLEALTTIGGYLQISANGSLINLTGLDNLTSVGGFLSIKSNSGLTDLTGLNKLTAIGGYLQIYRNESLVEITAMDSLMSISGDLFIWKNANLSSIKGLGHINAGSIIDLTISENANLSTCEVQSICEYLASPNGIVDIYNNAPGCNNLTEIADSCHISLSCLPYGNYHFFNQEDIDNFQAYFPGCIELEGDVFIGDYMEESHITDLYGLNEVISIGGKLLIQYNKDLMSLSGLNSLTSTGNGTQIGYNDALINLSGLENLTSTGGWLGIHSNPALTSLLALENLTTGVSPLGITNNDALISLSGIDNIETGSISYIEVYENDSLSTCGVQSICEYLFSPTGYIDIHNNATGCDDMQEVKESCVSTSEKEHESERNFSIFPNPASDQFTIAFTLEHPARVKLEVLDNMGQAVAVILDEAMAQGEHQVTWNAEGLPSGIYFYRLAQGSQSSTGRMVVVN
jgi:hypothetical protein